MKTFIAFLMIALSIAFTSCEKEQLIDEVVVTDTIMNDTVITDTVVIDTSHYLNHLPVNLNIMWYGDSICNPNYRTISIASWSGEPVIIERIEGIDFNGNFVNFPQNDAFVNTTPREALGHIYIDSGKFVGKIIGRFFIDNKPFTYDFELDPARLYIATLSTNEIMCEYVEVSKDQPHYFHFLYRSWYHQDETDIERLVITRTVNGTVEILMDIYDLYALNTGWQHTVQPSNVEYYEYWDVHIYFRQFQQMPSISYRQVVFVK